jgi:hypothetical protein
MPARSERLGDCWPLTLRGLLWRLLSFKPAAATVLPLHCSHLTPMRDWLFPSKGDIRRAAEKMSIRFTPLQLVAAVIMQQKCGFHPCRQKWRHPQRF